MSFSAWFKQWLGALLKLFTFNYKKPKSDSQRRRERERRLKARYSSANLFRNTKERKKRRSSMSVENEKLLTGLFNFIGASLIGILMIPFGLLDLMRKSTGTRCSKNKKTPSKTVQKKTKAQSSRKTVKSSLTHTATDKTETDSTTPSRLFDNPENKEKSTVAETPTVTEPDENTPKSTSENEKDQYIRKRMMIAGSYYCDKDVLDKLAVGSHIDLVAEPDNPYDKYAVMLLFNDQKIGYISKNDNMAFATCLKLKRKIYGIITAIIEEDGQTKYEFETWYDSVRQSE